MWELYLALLSLILGSLAFFATRQSGRAAPKASQSKTTRVAQPKVQAAQREKPEYPAEPDQTTTVKPQRAEAKGAEAAKASPGQQNPKQERPKPVITARLRKLAIPLENEDYRLLDSPALKQRQIRFMYNDKVYTLVSKNGGSQQVRLRDEDGAEVTPSLGSVQLFGPDLAKIADMELGKALTERAGSDLATRMYPLDTSDYDKFSPLFRKLNTRLTYQGNPYTYARKNGGAGKQLMLTADDGTQIYPPIAQVQISGAELDKIAEEDPEFAEAVREREAVVPSDQKPNVVLPKKRSTPGKLANDPSSDTELGDEAGEAGADDDDDDDDDTEGWEEQFPALQE